MIHRTNKIFLFIFCCGLFSLSFSCQFNKSSTALYSTYNLPPGSMTLDGSYWWRCRFKNVWPEEVEAEGAIDLLLAHAVVKPVLSKHIENIPYWRFHRRATRDAAGHQFSFLFYSRPSIAAEVFSGINQSGHLSKAIDANLIEKVLMDDPDKPKSGGIDDTSDLSWPPELQRNWPAYIMGVSSLWLGLIDDLVQNKYSEIDDPEELLEQYRKVEKKINEQWRNEGQHALLHHLSAVFGYQPMLIKKELSF